MMKRLMFASLAAALWAVTPAHADESAAVAGPQCNADFLGGTACLDGVLCECVSSRGGTITGEVAGFRWRCDALRPRCGPHAAGGLPATIPPAAFPYPHSVGIDRSRETTIIDQNQNAVQGQVNNQENDNN